MKFGPDDASDLSVPSMRSPSWEEGGDAATATGANNTARTIGSPAMLANIWRVPLPETEEVLATVAGNYPR